MHKLYRPIHTPGTVHWKAISRIMSYLKKTIQYDIFYGRHQLILEGYLHASWILAQLITSQHWMVFQACK